MHPVRLAGLDLLRQVITAVLIVVFRYTTFGRRFQVVGANPTNYDPAKALNVGAVDDAAAVEHYVRLARDRLSS